MTVRHSDREDFARFLQGRMSAGETRGMVRALLANYRKRRQGDRRPDGDAESSAWRERFDRLFARSTAHLAERADALAREREAAAERFVELLARAAPERKALVQTDRAYQSWCLCERLLDSFQQEIYDDRAAAAERAELALAVADRLDRQWYGNGLIHDLAARAWAALGEARRVAADLRGAEEALAEAERRVGEGSGDGLEEAQVLEVKAALRRDQRRLPEALRLLDEVVEIYRHYRDFHLVGRAFLQMGQAHAALGNPEVAIHWLRKGIALLDPLRERRLELAARHSLMLQLFESGRPEEAWFLLKASRPDFQTEGGALLNLRQLWLEGKIQLSLGRPEAAEAAFGEARRGFVAQGLGFDSALVSLDLAELYARQGRAQEMRRLAEAMLPVFQGSDLHREAIAALLVFQEAVRRERVSSALLERIGGYLRQARTDPGLRFEAPNFSDR